MKIAGIIIIGIGIAGVLHDWIHRYQNRQKRLEEIIFFLRKAVYAMEENKVHWIIYFEEYKANDKCLELGIHNVSQKLKENRYPRGEQAWQESMCERKADLDLSKEAFETLLSCGKAFFGKSQKENVELMRMYIQLFTDCSKKEKQEFAEKKKLWIPLSALGGMMIVIILI